METHDQSGFKTVLAEDAMENDEIPVIEDIFIDFAEINKYFF